MSDMKTFTVRQLDRETARVMDACDEDGAVQIRRRDGRSYTMRRERNGNFSMRDWLEERRRKTKELFPKALSKKQTQEFDKLIRSDRD